MRLLSLTIVLLYFLVLVEVVGAQTPPPIPHGPTNARYTGWEISRVFPQWSFEYKDGVCVGAASRETFSRFTYVPTTMTWKLSPVTYRPNGPPPVGVKEDPPFVGPNLPERNEGLDRDELSKDRPQYRFFDGSRHPHELTREETLRILGSSDSDKVPNDIGKPWLIAIGNAEFLKRVSADLDASPQLKARVRYQGYTPDHWRAKQIDLSNVPKYVASGTALLIATKDGVLAHGQFDYQPGDLNVLGQKFDPARIPDLRIPERVGEGIIDQLFKKFEGVSPAVWVGLGVLIMLLFRGPQK